MTPRFAALALAPLFIAATAHAQAPGEWTPPPAGPSYAAPPPAAPVVVAPAGPRFPQKFSIGLNVGGTDVTPEGYEDQSAQFSTAQLALRYRITRHLELELSFHGGRQQLADGYEGDLAMAGGTLAARYRFRVDQPLNWWVMGGFGATTIARHDASDAELDAAQRGHGTLGLGVEYRFNRFGIQAEGRATGYAQTETEQMAVRDYGQEMPGLSGGTFTLGGSFYF